MGFIVESAANMPTPRERFVRFAAGKAFRIVGRSKHLSVRYHIQIQRVAKRVP